MLDIQGFQFQILAYVGLAMLLGAAIGLEREIEGKPAGLRTHMLVAGAAALLVALDDVMIKHFDVALGSELVRSDPTHIIQAVITGVSFLGAGTILRFSSTRQLRDSPPLPRSCSLPPWGCVALSQLLLAAGVTVLMLVTLRGVGRAEKWLERRQR